jgi:hypothetical protein
VEKNCNYFEFCLDHKYGYCPIADLVSTQKDSGATQRGGWTRSAWQNFISNSRARGGVCSVDRHDELVRSFSTEPGEYKES